MTKKRATKKTQPKAETKAREDRQITKHFRASEFWCKDSERTEAPPELQLNLLFLVQQLERVRERAKVPFIINSGYRTEAHNKEVKGEDNSKHLLAMAADIATPPGWTPERLHGLFLSMLERKEIAQGGLGIYNWGVHYDVYPSGPRRWDSRE